MFVYLNGNIIKKEKAMISIYDHGFLYGDGIYETIRVVNGRIEYLTEHLKRLKQSAQTIYLKLPKKPRQINNAINQLLKMNRQKNAVIRIFISRGPGPYGFDIQKCKNPTIVITAEPFQGYPQSFYEKGITAAIVSTRRNSPLSIPPSAKTTNCLNGILAKEEARGLKAYEAIMLDLKGNVTEGSVSNVFCLKGGKVYTPALDGNLLPGVIRSQICLQARRAGYTVIEKKLSRTEFVNADSIFIANSLVKILPIRTLTWRTNGIQVRRSYKINLNFRGLRELIGQ